MNAWLAPSYVLRFSLGIAWVPRNSKSHSQQRPHPSIPMPTRFPPDSGERLVAVGAEAVFLDAGAEDEEAVSRDDGRAAVVAARVLPLADLAGEVAGVQVLQ